MGDAPKSWDNVNGTAHITALPVKTQTAHRFYHVYGRRSSDFAVLSEIEDRRTEGAKAEART